MSETETDYEQSDDHESTPEIEIQRRPHRGGKSGHHKREEPTSLTDLQACPLAVTCFRYLSCYEFCEKVANIQFHHEFSCLFVLHLHGDQATLAGVTFTLTPETISLAIGIPNIGEPWNKRQKIDRQHYEPYIKPGFFEAAQESVSFSVPQG